MAARGTAKWHDRRRRRGRRDRPGRASDVQRRCRSRGRRVDLRLRRLRDRFRPGISWCSRFRSKLHRGRRGGCGRRRRGHTGPGVGHVRLGPRWLGDDPPQQPAHQRGAGPGCGPLGRDRRRPGRWWRDLDRPQHGLLRCRTPNAGPQRRRRGRLLRPGDAGDPQGHRRRLNHRWILGGSRLGPGRGARRSGNLGRLSGDSSGLPYRLRRGRRLRLARLRGRPRKPERGQLLDHRPRLLHRPVAGARRGAPGNLARDGRGLLRCQERRPLAIADRGTPRKWRAPHRRVAEHPGGREVAHARRRLHCGRLRPLAPHRPGAGQPGQRVQQLWPPALGDRLAKQPSAHAGGRGVPRRDAVCEPADAAGAGCRVVLVHRCSRSSRRIASDSSRNRRRSPCSRSRIVSSGQWKWSASSAVSETSVLGRRPHHSPRRPSSISAEVDLELDTARRAGRPRPTASPSELSRSYSRWRWSKSAAYSPSITAGVIAVRSPIRVTVAGEQQHGQVGLVLAHRRVAQRLDLVAGRREAHDAVAVHVPRRRRRSRGAA